MEVVVVCLLDLETGTPVEVGDALDSPLALQALEGSVHGCLPESRASDLRPLQDILWEQRATRCFECVPDRLLLSRRARHAEIVLGISWSDNENSLSLRPGGPHDD